MPLNVAPDSYSRYQRTVLLLLISLPLSLFLSLSFFLPLSIPLPLPLYPSLFSLCLVPTTCQLYQNKSSFVFAFPKLRLSNHCSNSHSDVLVSVVDDELNQKFCGTLKISPGLTQKDQVYTFLCHSKGDAVLLHKSTGNIAFADIIVETIGK